MKRILTWRWGAWSVPLALLAVALLCYGIFFRWLGFYWDDFPFAWMSSVYGPEGLARYFSTNRPFWGLIYQFTTPILGSEPWHWQIFGVFWRWLAAVGWWLVVRRAWPGREKLAAASALFFLVYPGFGQQSIGLMYAHFFIVYCALIFSFYASLRALKASAQSTQKKNGLQVFGWTGIGLLLSFVNLICMEYFFPLEALRPLLFWAAMPEKRGWQRVKAAFRAWLPYLALLIAVTLWRVFFFSYQTQNYDLLLLEQLKTAPFQAILALAGEILRSLWVTGVAAWLKPLLLDPAALATRTTTLLYAAISLSALVGSALYFARLRGDDENARRSQPLAPLFIGLAGLLLAGWPFWITSLPVRATFPNDRFSLPFMLGASLLTAAALDLIPNIRMGKRSYPLGNALLAALLALSIGTQFQNATLYRRDWTQQKSFFWQLRWRAPGLQPGTTIFSNDLPLRFYSDNSLTAPLNWIYAGETPTTAINYAFYYPSVRLGRSLPALQPNLTIKQDYLVGQFTGSTSQVLTIYYDPPACLRVIDPLVEKDYLGLPGLMREAAALSDTRWIDPAGDAQLPAHLYSPEPAHGWCYYFSQAELARQMQDWPQVADLAEQAFALGDTPNDPMERMVFIEGYAHTAQWEPAIQLTQKSLQITPLMQPPLCALWGRIRAETPADAAQQAALSQVEAELGCPAAP